MPTIHRGENVTAANIITGAGRLRGFLICHDQAAVEQVTFYDNTEAAGTVLVDLWIAPQQTPYYLMLPENDALVFSTGLSVGYVNATILVWAVAH